MWFLKFWLISIIAAYIITGISASATKKRLEEQGYRIKKCQTSLAEHIQAFFPCYIPYCNIVVMLIMILTPPERMDSIMLAKLRERNLLKEPGEW